MPVDDENTLSLGWFFMRVPKGREPFVQDSVSTWVSPIRSTDGRWVSTHVINQDIIAWVGQGRIADRSKEFLGASDRGIAMIRKRPATTISMRHRAGPGAQGDHPQLNVARCVELPYSCASQKRSVEGITLEDRQISFAEGAPAGLPALLWPASGGAARVRTRHGHREVSDGGIRKP